MGKTSRRPEDPRALKYLRISVRQATSSKPPIANRLDLTNGEQRMAKSEWLLPPAASSQLPISRLLFGTLTFVTLALYANTEGDYTMNIKEIAAQTLQDAQCYLKEIDPQVYAMPLELLFGASIGQHTRHFVEFYQCLLDQTEGEGNIVNYALRARDLRIEENPEFASERIQEICARLLSLNASRNCQLVCDEHIEEQSGITVDSNIGREIVYNIEHTIHHLAIIKIGLYTIAPGITLPSHFGVAPSTIQHKQKICAQ